MGSFWIHSDGTKLLDSGGYEVELGKKRGFSPRPSAKATVWSDKDAVLAFCKRRFKGLTLRDNGTTVDVDIPADDGWPNRPARTLRFQEVIISAP